MVDGTKIEETATLESSVSKMFCICMTSLWNKGQVILGPCIKWIPHHKCFWQRNKKTNKPKEYRTTQQPGFKPSLSFHCASFYSKYFLLLTAKLADSADWPFGQSFEEWSERKGLGSCANYCWTLCRHCTHFLCPHWGSAWGFYHAVFLFHSGRNACFWLDRLAVKAWSRPAQY